MKQTRFGWVGTRSFMTSGQEMGRILFSQSWSPHGVSYTVKPV